MCPLLWDVLGAPTQLDYAPGGIYFNRSEVKAAIHAPSHIDWTVCATKPVFVGGEKGPQSTGDLSLDPIQKVLPQVIEATNRVLISNGDFGKIYCSKEPCMLLTFVPDYVILTNGTLLSIQNMTWNGQLGFQSAPNEDIVIDIIDTQWSSVYEANYREGYPGAQGVMGIQVSHHCMLGSNNILTHQSSTTSEVLCGLKLFSQVICSLSSNRDLLIGTCSGSLVI